MKFAIPQIEVIEIPIYIIVPLVWFIFLWICRIFFMRCECGAFYHTDEEKKEFLKFVIGSILSSMVIFAGLVVWGI